MTKKVMVVGTIGHGSAGAVLARKLGEVIATTLQTKGDSIELHCRQVQHLMADLPSLVNESPKQRYDKAEWKMNQQRHKQQAKMRLGKKGR